MPFDAAFDLLGFAVRCIFLTAVPLFCSESCALYGEVFDEVDGVAFG